MIIKYRDEINIQKFSIQIPDLTKKRFNKTNRFLSNFRKIEEISRFFPKHFSLRICTALNLKKKFTSNLWIRAERRISSNYHLHRNAFTPVTFPVKRGRLTRVDYFQGRPLPAGVSLTLLLLREGEKDAGI